MTKKSRESHFKFHFSEVEILLWIPNLCQYVLIYFQAALIFFIKFIQVLKCQLSNLAVKPKTILH